MLEDRVSQAMALQEILAGVGYAVWQAQVLERAVAYHLVAVYGDSDDTAGAKAAEAFSIVEKKTLGFVLSRIEKRGPQDADLFAKLDAFREKRNWLVHHSRHDYPSALRDPAAKSVLMELLEEIGSAAAPLAKEVQNATDEYLIAHSIRTREELADTAQRILDIWRGSGCPLDARVVPPT